MKRTTHDCDICKRKDMRPRLTLILHNITKEEIDICEECASLCPNEWTKILKTKNDCPY